MILILIDIYCEYGIVFAGITSSYGRFTIINNMFAQISANKVFKYICTESKICSDTTLNLHCTFKIIFLFDRFY